MEDRQCRNTVVDNIEILRNMEESNLRTRTESTLRAHIRREASLEIGLFQLKRVYQLHFGRMRQSRFEALVALRSQSMQTSRTAQGYLVTH